jgi:hypothetical protein
MSRTGHPKGAKYPPKFIGIGPKLQCPVREVTPSIRIRTCISPATQVSLFNNLVLIVGSRPR